jgi:hypothetical protein
MQSNDPWEMASYHQQDLLAEAESERLLSMLPERPPLHVRHKLAMACFRLASWLDTSAPYFPPADCGGEDWATPPARA